MAVSAKTLRKLGKQVGIQPSKLFRMKPEEVAEVLEKEHGLKDIGVWEDSDAENWISEQKVSEAVNSEEEVVETIEEKEAPKEEAKKSPKKAPKKAPKKEEAIEQVEERNDTNVENRPSRRRKKKAVPFSDVAPTFSKGSIEGSVEELKERVIGLEGDIAELKAAIKDLTSFMAWWHNLQLDPKDPITSLSAVDWEGCIDDQMKS